MGLMGFILITMSVQAQLLAPEQYPEGTCELAAKEYQKVSGGDLIFVQPLKEDGSFDLGDYKGTWMNKAWDKSRGTYYINYPDKSYFNRTQDIVAYYKSFAKKDVVVYNLNEVHPPFSIIWHY